MGKNKELIYLTGQRFGHWTVLKKGTNKKTNGDTYWLCRCDCGTEKEVCSKSLRRGRSTNCGCSNKWKRFNWAMGENLRLAHVWQNMMQRCYNNKCPNYHNYGGRGITVCDEWHDYRNFVEWAYRTGYDKDAPRGLFTIERIDVNKGYSPCNCRWATSKEQSINKRTSVFLTVDGIKRNVTEWAKVIGVHRSTVSYWNRQYGSQEAVRRIREAIGA